MPPHRGHELCLGSPVARQAVQLSKTLAPRCRIQASKPKVIRQCVRQLFCYRPRNCLLQMSADHYPRPSPSTGGARPTPRRCGNPSNSHASHGAAPSASAREVRTAHSCEGIRLKDPSPVASVPEGGPERSPKHPSKHPNNHPPHLSQHLPKHALSIQVSPNKSPCFHTS